MFKVRYTGDVDETDVDGPLNILKKDQSIDMARYISKYVLGDKRNDRYNSWKKNTMKKLARTIWIFLTESMELTRKWEKMMIFI